MNHDDLYRLIYLNQRCPQCGNRVNEWDKDTSSGRDLRYFHCDTCGWSGSVDVGIALWKAISLASKQNTEDED